MTPDAAGRWLGDALNPDKADVLSAKQLVVIAKIGHQHGVHTTAAQFNFETGYAEPLPIEPKDEAAQLEKEFIRSIDRAGELVGRLEKLRDTAPLKAVRSGT
jgi:hypothetical protein